MKEGRTDGKKEGKKGIRERELVLIPNIYFCSLATMDESMPRI